MTTQPDSYSNGSAIAGANDLQAHIDALTRAVEQNTSAVQSSDNGNGTTTTVSQASQAGGARFTTGSQNSMAAGGNAASGGAAGGGNAVTSLTGGTGGTNNGGSLLNFSITKTGSLLGGVANFASTLINASGNVGANMINDALTQNTYGYMIQNAGYANNGKTITGQQAQNSLYGTISNGQVQNGNRLANNASDAALGGSMLTQLSNNPMFAQTAGTMTNAQAQATFGGYGTSPYITAAGVGLANPGLGEQGAANVAQAFISPTASYNLQQLGVATQPIGIGGKSNSLSSVEGAISQRLMGQKPSASGTISQKTLTTDLNDPLMQYQVMQATGMTADEYQEWANSWEQQNQGALASGKSLGQVQQGIAQFTAGKITAAQLQKQYGVSASAYENTIQSQQSTSMAGENTVNQQFISGLSSATTAVNGLTIIMTGLLAALGGAGAKVSGASAGAGAATASGILGTGMGSTITEGAALAGVTPTVFNSALGSAINSAVNGMETASGATSQSSGSSAKKGNSPPTGSAGSASATATETSWIKAFLADLKAPSSAANISSIQAWIGHEKPSGQPLQWNNPLNIGTPGSDSQGRTGTYPVGPGIAMYDTPANGAHADADFILKNGYSQILSQLQGGKGLRTGAGSDLSRWSGGAYTSLAQGGQIIVGERGPEILSFANGGTANIINASRARQILQGSDAMPVQAPWTTANRLLSQGGSTPAAGGVHITIEKGAVTMGTNYQGMFTSQDAQSAASQFEQALTKALTKSQTLQALASGVTG